MKQLVGDFFLKGMAMVALFLMLQMKGYIPIIQPIVELSEEDEEVLMDFGSPMMRDQIEARREQWNRKKTSKRK